MLKVPLYNMDGKKVGEQELSAAVFGVDVKPTVLHEAAVAQLSASRKVIAHTKTRGEVRGGGKKPWKQKGTGRARHGSIRSPIWKGGGVVFGPRNTRNYEKKINRKVKQQALRMALTDKVAHDRLLVLETLTAAEYKTKTMVKMLKALPVGRKVLVALPARDQKVVKSLANLPQVTSVNVGSLNITVLLGHDTVLTTAAGTKKMEEMFG
ncbi:50S ribosomal protein L4 [Patescibacteria group bacterium]|nr:MAG: 50S ribosomal protein L4 [Patescibacteria group bacterium]